MSSSKDLIAFVAETSKKLAALGCPKRAKDTEKYMKSVVRSHGLVAKEVENFVKVEFADREEHHEDLALEFIRSPFQEEKDIGIRLWRSGDVALREQVFEKGHITGWAANDSACARILKPGCKSDPEWRLRVSKWGRGATNLWTVRASCVAFISTVKDKDCRIAALDAAKFALTESPFRQERFVQLGAGWILREIGVADRKLADGFIKTNLHCFSPEGLSYATEKLPDAKRKAWREKLKEAREKLKEVPDRKRQRVKDESED